MKSLLLFSIIVFPCAAAFARDKGPAAAFHNDPAPPSSTLTKDLLWIADTRKMDRFLAQVDLTTIRRDAYTGEVVPDTRVAWRDYATEAVAFASKGDDEAVNNRIGQMLKLAALYRQFGGLQNVAQGEEIRALAGRTVQALGYGGLLHSPYLEASVADSLAAIERQAGGEKGEVRPAFWQHLLENAELNYARLSGQSHRGLATASSTGFPH